MRQLKYFKINSSLEDLKKERNKYALQYHPDRQKSEALAKVASDKMALINDEYDYVTDPENRVSVISPSAGGPIFTPGTKTKFTDQWKHHEKELRQAQNFFHAFTNAKGVDMELLVNTANAIKNWTIIFLIYKSKYGSEFSEHLNLYVKNKTHLKVIKDFINESIKDNVSKNINNIFNVFSKIFKP